MSEHGGTMINPIKCETHCPTCGCCEHTPASKPCDCSACSCAHIFTIGVS